MDEWDRICGCCICGKKWKQRNMGCEVPFLQATYGDSQRAADYEGWLCECGVVCGGEVQAFLQPLSTCIYSNVLLLFGGEVKWDEEDKRNERMS